VEAQWAIRCFGYSDARSDSYLRLVTVVVDDAQGCLATGHVNSVVRTSDGECAAEFAGATSECPSADVMGEAAVVHHCFLAGDRVESANEDAAGVAIRLAGNVETVVNAVYEIDIRVARWPKQDCIACGATGGGVSSRVVDAEVGFGFDNTTGEDFAIALSEYYFAEEMARDDVRCSVVEATRQRLKFPESWGI